MMRWREYAIVGLLTGWFVTAAGCGVSSQPSVKGHVTLDGEAVGPGGRIVFLPQRSGEGRQAAAAIEEGKYDIPAERGPSLGPCRVEITWAKRTGKQVPSADPGFMMDQTREAIPTKYNSQSSLTVEIRPGENVHDFRLQSR